MGTIIIKENELYGVMGQKGELIVEPKFDNMKEFTNGFAAVCKADKWGYIDEDGNQIIDFLYDNANNFSENGIAGVKLSENLNSWVLIKTSGELITMQDYPGYYSIGEFNPYGYAIAKPHNFYCIIDENGNHINDKLYHSISYLEKQGAFQGKRVGNLCLINRLGEVVVDPDDDYDIVYFPSNGMCQVDKDGKFGYINDKGKLVIDLKYESACEFSENGLAYVEYDGLGGYINKLGEFVIKPVFDSGTVFENGLAAVSQKGKHFYIYGNGTRAIESDFKYAGEFSKCGLAKVITLDGETQFIRIDSGVVVTMRHGADADEFIGNKKITPIRIKGKVGLMDKQGAIVIENIYDEIIISPYGDFHQYLKDGLWGYIDDEGRKITDNLYVEASEFSSGYIAQVRLADQGDKKGSTMYIDDRSNIICDSLVEAFWRSFDDDYTHVHDFYEDLAMAMKRGALEILNNCGEEIAREGVEL